MRLLKAEAALQRAQKHHDRSIEAGQRLLAAWSAVVVARALRDTTSEAA